MFHGAPVTVIGHRKGRNLDEHLRYHFGMPSPEGYRKAGRLMAQAEKFQRPVITFIDTPGAYPGLEAEAHGQGDAIARSLARMSRLRVPVISVITGEGGSGGALALCVADRVWMLENAVYSVISPEGCASILWHEPGRAAAAAENLCLTAQDAQTLGVIEEIVSEEDLGEPAFYERLRERLEETAEELSADPELLAARYERFRKIGRL